MARRPSARSAVSRCGSMARIPGRGNRRSGGLFVHEEPDCALLGWFTSRKVVPNPMQVARFLDAGMPEFRQTVGLDELFIQTGWPGTILSCLVVIVDEYRTSKLHVWETAMCALTSTNQGGYERLLSRCTSSWSVPTDAR